MVQGADQRDLVLPGYGVEVQRHIEASILAQRNRIGELHSLAGFEETVIVCYNSIPAVSAKLFADGGAGATWCRGGSGSGLAGSWGSG